MREYVTNSGLWSICAFAFGQNRSNLDVVHAGVLKGKPRTRRAPGSWSGRDRVAEPVASF